MAAAPLKLVAQAHAWLTMLKWSTNILLNKLIVSLNLAKFIPMLKSPQKKREKVPKIGEGTADNMKVNLRVRIMRATDLPCIDAPNKMTGFKGSCDCYVKVKHGTKQFVSKPVMEDLNPKFNLEYVFESRKDSIGVVSFELWDYGRDGDDAIGKFEVKVSQIIQRVKIEKAFELFDIKTGMIPVKSDTNKATKLRVQLTWDQEGADGESEWLNGILRSSYRCFSADVDSMVRQRLISSFKGLKLPMMSLSLESFSIGNAAPFFNEMRVLTTRSPHNLQIRAHLRWVASGDFGIKVRALTSLGIGCTVEVGGLEIDFPVWIQVILQPDLKNPVAKIQLAATADPKIRFCLGLGPFSTKTLPGIEEGIDFAIRKALRKFLVLPKKITKDKVPNYIIPLTPLEKDAKAKLNIKVLRAENLENKNTVGSLNPYVLLTSSGGTQDTKPDGKPNQEMRTKAVKASRNNDVCWNEYFEFLITDEQTEKVTLQIMDPSDTGFSNDAVCGTMELSASEILQSCENGSGWQEEWYQLLNCKSGRIKLAIEYGRCEPDDGPTEVDCVSKTKVGQAPSKLFELGNIVIQVVKAIGLPSSFTHGKPSTYVSVEFKSEIGVATGRTTVAENDCNPEWQEDIVLSNHRVPTDKSKIPDKDIKLTLRDNNGLGSVLGEMILKLKDVIAATPGKEITVEIKDRTGKQIGTKATITVAAFFERRPAEATVAVGGDWINGILRKAWIVLTDQIEEKVKEVVGEVLHKIRYPAPDPKTGEPVEPPSALKLYKELLLDSFELGQEPPSVFQLKMLNTRSDQDIQLITAIRWCASDNWAIKVCCQGSSTGVPDLSLALTGLDVWMPLWIQVRLAGGNTGLGADVLELAALEDPVIKLQVSARVGMFPGGINTDTILGMIRPVLRNALVLPNRITICLMKDPVSGLPMAADKKKVTHPAQKKAAKEMYDKVMADVDAAKKDLAAMKVDAAGKGPAIAEKEAAISKLEGEAAVYKGRVEMDWPMDERTIEKDAKNRLSISNLCKVMEKDATGKVVPCQHLAVIPTQKDATGKDTGKPAQGFENAKVCKIASQIAMNKKTKYQYLCACRPAVQDEKGIFPPDPAGMPIYESIYDFKVKHLRLDDRQKHAVGRLSVKLIEADDLRDPDAWGTVDAFCEIQLVGTGNKIKSSTVFNDTAPVWLEFYDFLIVEENEVLKFEVFDEDMSKVDFLGKVEIPVKELVQKSGWRDGWFPLQKAPGGELHVGLCYRKLEPNDGPVASNTFVDCTADENSRTLDDESPYKGMVMVTIQKAENLIKLDTAWSEDKGLDPYVVIDFGNQTKKTKVKDTLNPIWNETYGFNCKDGASAFTIILKDKEKLQNDRDIGIVTLKMDDLVDRPGKRCAQAWEMRNPEDKQTCKNAKGLTSLLYMVFQYVEEGDPIPAEPTPLGPDGVVSRNINDVPVRVKATIFLRVIKAEHLPKMDFMTGKADPYVTVTINGVGNDKTRVIDANLDPEWNEDITPLQPEQDSTKSLELTIKDYNISGNTYMGQVVIPIKDIRVAKNISNQVYQVVDKKGTQLKGKDGKPSTLTLTMEWKDAPEA